MGCASRKLSFFSFFVILVLNIASPSSAQIVLEHESDYFSVQYFMLPPYHELKGKVETASNRTTSERILDDVLSQDKHYFNEEKYTFDKQGNVTEFSYAGKDFDGTVTGKGKYTYAFNKNSQMISRVQQDFLAKTSERRTADYDKHGRPTRVQIFGPDGTLVRTITHQYDEKGLLERITDGPDTTITFSYGPEGKQKVISLLDAQGYSTLKTSFTYDNQLRLTAKSTFSNENDTWKLTEKIEFKYLDDTIEQYNYRVIDGTMFNLERKKTLTNKGLLLKESVYETNYQQENRTTFTYTDQGQVKEELRERFVAGSEEALYPVRTSFVYNNQGQVLTRSTNGALEYEASYDERGNVILTTTYDEQGQKTLMVEASYDSNNNFIKRVTNWYGTDIFGVMGLLSRITEVRTIKYFR